ncbi:MAG: hypothetical protein R2748_03025 [Bryobacterales bacterium]
MTQEKTSTLKNIAVAGALALSLGGNAYLLHEVRGLQSDLGGFRQDAVAQFRRAQERTAAAAGETLAPSKRWNKS